MSEEGAGRSFEAAIAELEAVVAQLDSGQLSLEDSLRTFERGVALQRHCIELLGAAQQRVEVLTEAATADLTGEATSRLERFGRATLAANSYLANDGNDPFAASDPGR
jgi:exodeoxyribonuclease VII small subunit